MKIEPIIIAVERIIGTSHRTIQSIYQERTIKRTPNIIKDRTHPATRYYGMADYVHSGASRDSLTVFILLQYKHSILILCVNELFFLSHVFNIVPMVCKTSLFICFFFCIE